VEKWVQSYFAALLILLRFNPIPILEHFYPPKNFQIHTGFAVFIALKFHHDHLQASSPPTYAQFICIYALHAKQLESVHRRALLELFRSPHWFCCKRCDLRITYSDRTAAKCQGC
jgi:hypothetical protein